jgi:hypothetical protein
MQMQTTNKTNEHRDLDFLLYEMFTDSTTLGVEAYLTDAMTHLEFVNDNMALEFTDVELKARWQAFRIIEQALYMQRKLKRTDKLPTIVIYGRIEK